MKYFQNMGVYHVVQPEFETGLEFTRQALLHLDLPVDRIQQFTDEIRHELYRPLYDVEAEYKSIAQLQNSSRLFRLTWVTIGPNSELAGKTIGQSKIRTLTGVTIAGILRDGKFYANPEPDFMLAQQDMVGVLGKTDQLTVFQGLSNPLDAKEG